MIKIPSFSKSDLETYYEVACRYFVGFLISESGNHVYDPVRTFLQFISGSGWVSFDDDKLRDLLIGDKNKLDAIIGQIGSFNNTMGDTKHDDLYDNFISTKIGYLIPTFSGLKTCPYCNMSPIKVVMGAYKPPYDHYYPRNNYPYLVISAYNLIPCCSECNSKKSDEGIVLYPYSEEFGDDVVFRAERCNDPKKISVRFAVGKGVSSSSTLVTKAREQIQRLALGRLYREEKETIYDIVSDIIKCSPKYISSLNKSFSTSHNITVEESLNSVLKTNIKRDELHKKTFSKLHRDLCRQFIWKC